MKETTKAMIRPYLETIRDEVQVLLSGLPNSDESVAKRLASIEDAAENAYDLVRDGKVDLKQEDVEAANQAEIDQIEVAKATKLAKAEEMAAQVYIDKERGAVEDVPTLKEAEAPKPSTQNPRDTGKRRG